MRRFKGTALLALFAVGFAFNIDVKHAVVHRHTADTYFGYSIDIYQDSTQSLLVHFYLWLNRLSLLFTDCSLAHRKRRPHSRTLPKVVLYSGVRLTDRSAQKSFSTAMVRCCPTRIR